MTIERKLRVDDLGCETQFVVIDGSLTDYGRKQWETMLCDMQLGYIKIAARGGWRGNEEDTTIYRIAGLTVEQHYQCVKFLLDARWSPAIGALHRDLYVILPNGVAQGYSYEYEDTEIHLATFHGMVRKPQTWRDAEEFLDRQSPAARAKYHGTRKTGWGA